jgi:hypothetical protein
MRVTNIAWGENVKRDREEMSISLKFLFFSVAYQEDIREDITRRKSF